MSPFKQLTVGFFGMCVVATPVFAYININKWLYPAPFTVPADIKADIIYDHELKKPIDVFANLAQTFMPTEKTTISQRGIQFLIGKEGFEPKPYKKKGDKWTIGYGNTIWFDGSDVTSKTPAIDKKKAIQLFRYHINTHVEAPLRKCVTAPVTQDIWDALVSLTYNIGSGAACRSNVVKHLNNRNLFQFANSFYEHHRGRGVDGLLTGRRQKEQEMAMDAIYKTLKTARTLTKN